MKDSSSNKEETNRGFRKWALSGVGAIMVALATAWVLDVVGPKESTKHEYTIGGHPFSCDIELQGWSALAEEQFQERLADSDLDDDSKELALVAYLNVALRMRSAVFQKGVPGTMYRCYLSGTDFLNEIAMSKYLDADGNQCGKFTERTNLLGGSKQESTCCMLNGELKCDRQQPVN
jgi:hypothetical protein